MEIKPFELPHCMLYYVYCETQEELTKWAEKADWKGKPELDICSWVGGAKVKADWERFWEVVRLMEELKNPTRK